MVFYRTFDPNDCVLTDGRYNVLIQIKSELPLP